MATVLPPPSKRQRREELERSKVQQDVAEQLPQDIGSFKARFIDGDGNQMSDVVEIPLASATEKNVSMLLNTLLGRDRDDFTPYRFRIHIPNRPDTIIDQYPNNLLELLQKNGVENPFETTITLSAEPQAVFKVKAASRLAAKIPGHGQPILAASFSPVDHRLLATGSGDMTARIFDTLTGTPKHTLKGHTGWVLGCFWRQDGKCVATCSMDGSVRLWDPESGKPLGRELKGHGKPVLMLAWQPYHLWSEQGPLLASASKDGTIRTWVANSGITDHCFSGHKGSVTCVRWGAAGDTGMGLIYSSSHDRTIKCWDPKKGTLIHNMTSHAHWVNNLALSTDAVLRTAYFDHTKTIPETDEGKKAKAKERYDKVAKVQGKTVERLVSASDDCTLYLWDPINEGTKPIARMGGHQKQVNHVSFSPDGTVIASSGFDGQTKLWDGRNGQYLRTLRGHVSAVYQNSFSADGRLLVTSSKDTTLKIFNVRSGDLVNDLINHQDEVYAVDWSPDGQMVASGGKDKAVRTWRN